MKKFLALMLIATMLVAATACGNEKVINGKNDNVTSVDNNNAVDNADGQHNNVTVPQESDVIASQDATIVTEATWDDNGDVTDVTIQKEDYVHTSTQPETSNTQDNTGDLTNEQNHTTNNKTETNRAPIETAPAETKPVKNEKPEAKPSTSEKPEKNETIETSQSSENKPAKTEKPAKTGKTEDLETKPESTESSKPKPTETKPAETTDNSNNSSSNSPSNKNNAPYDGDTAVPPDAYETTDLPTKKCSEHDMALVNTKTNASYQLYNYVTKYYECSICGYVKSEVGIASSDVSSSTIAKAEKSIVSYVNQLRATHNLSELWTNEEWNAWAATRARELAKSYSHIRPDGSSWLHAEGTCYTVAENIAAGHQSGVSFYDAFYGSYSHKSAMLSADAVGIAVGIYVDENGASYCAMVLIGSY